MLQFFRRYQRFFFAIVTVVIVVSFSFFGTFSTMAQGDGVPDEEVLDGLDGSPITERELAATEHLIGVSSWHASGMIPFDQVLEQEVLGNGIGLLIARRHFEELKPELEQRLQAIRGYQPYVHRLASHVSARAVWDRWVPEISRHLMMLEAKSDQVTMETLALLIQLYLEQASLPPYFLKQILQHQIQQQGLPPDPALQQGDLSLFGFRSLEEWFGPRFVSLIAEYMTQVGRAARAKGCHVPIDQVRQDLYHQLAARGQERGERDLNAEYRQMVHAFGGDERLLLKTWQSILLFKQFFQGVDQMAMEELPFKQFQNYSKQALILRSYRLPESLKCRSLQDLFEWQVYREAMGQPEVLKALIDHQVEIRYAEVDRQQLLSRISLKQTWDFEVQEEGWVLLKGAFPELKNAVATTSVERLKVLQGLESGVRVRVDAYAKEQMVGRHPEWTLALLESAPWQQIKTSLREEGLKAFQIKQPAKLLALLKDAQGAIDYSDDGRHYYRFEVLSYETSGEIISFEKAKQEGVLTRMLDQRLSAAYPDLRRRYGAAFGKGEWQSTPEMRKKIGSYVFHDRLLAIETACHTCHIEVPTAVEEKEAFYVHYAFAPEIVAKRAHPEQELLNFDVKIEQIQRNSALPFAKAEMFALPLQELSPIVSFEPGQIAFYQVIGEETGASEKEAKAQGDYLLGIDVKRRVALEILNHMQSIR